MVSNKEDVVKELENRIDNHDTEIAVAVQRINTLESAQLLTEKNLQTLTNSLNDYLSQQTKVVNDMTWVKRLLIAPAVGAILWVLKNLWVALL